MKDEDGVQQKGNGEGAVLAEGTASAKAWSCETLCTGSGTLNRPYDGTLKELMGHKTVLFVYILSGPPPRRRKNVSNTRGGNLSASGLLETQSLEQCLLSGYA